MCIMLMWLDTLWGSSYRCDGQWAYVMTFHLQFDYNVPMCLHVCDGLWCDNGLQAYVMTWYNEACQDLWWSVCQECLAGTLMLSNIMPSGLAKWLGYY